MKYKKMEEYLIDESGVYLIGQTAFDPYTEEKHYLIKVGKSKNIKKRLRQYFSMNPAFWICDTQPWEENDLDFIEKELQYILRRHSIKPTMENESFFHNKEWFEVDKDFYLKFCEGGYYFLDDLAAIEGSLLEEEPSFDNLEDFLNYFQPEKEKEELVAQVSAW